MENIKNDIWRIYLKYQRDGVYKSTKKRISLRNKRINTARYLRVKSQIEHLYCSQEYGIKLLAREFGLTYTVVRQLLNFLEIPMRKGRDVVTDRVKVFRKEKAIYESKNRIGFNDKTIKRKCEGMARGVQGYYLNRSTNSLVWLRSSWEYIFAKWLDKTNHNWKIEDVCYQIDDMIYRPDFFIFDENWKLIKIVEIKGYWDNNSEKALKLNETLKIDVIIIRDIEKYIPSDSKYHKELSEWKTKRILKDGENQINQNI